MDVDEMKWNVSPLCKVPIEYLDEKGGNETIGWIVLPIDRLDDLKIEQEKNQELLMR